MPDATTARRLTEDDLRAIIRKQLEHATGTEDGEISADRRQAMEYYLGEPFGNEIDGHSKIVSTDVADTIESVMPDLVQIFAAGEEVVRFDPVSEEDEQPSRQATDYVNHIFNKDNPGFNILYDWFKDALIGINGFVKVWWDEKEKVEKRFFSGLTDEQMALIVNEEGVEVLEHTEYPAAEDSAMMTVPDGMAGDGMPPPVAPMLHDIKIARTETRGRVKIETVPPEEFLIERGARDIESARFVAHNPPTTASDLIEMGFSREVVDRLASSDDREFNQEVRARATHDDEWPYTDEEPDYSTRPIRFYDCYIRLDWDGDGISELRQIMVAGEDYTILLNEEAETIPFVSITPIRMPHRFYGRSLAELVEDIQLLKSTLWRQLLDNLYNLNNQRHFVNDTVDLDDYLNNRVGGFVRVSGDKPISDSVLPMENVSIARDVAPALEYCDTVRETRTGVTRYGQGLDGESLNKTATGINQILGRQQQRILLIARVFAEGGVKDAFRKILRLVIQNQDQPRTIRLRNQWVPVDPRSWNAEMDVSVSVGLGYGTNESRMAGLMMLGQVLEKIVTYQQGIAGPLVDVERIRNWAQSLVAQLGFKQADRFIADEGKLPLPPPKEDPKMAEAKMKMQLEGAKAQNDVEIERMKLDMERERMRDEMALRREEMYLKHSLEIEKANTDAAIKGAEFETNTALSRQKTEADIQIKKESAQQKPQSPVKVSVGNSDDMKQFMDGMAQVAQGMTETAIAMKEAVAQMNRPRKVVRGRDGRVEALQ